MKELIRKNKEFVGLVGITAIVSTVTALIAPVMIQQMNQREELSFDFLPYIFAAMLLSLVIQIAITVYKENYAAKFNTQYLFSLIQKMTKMTYDSYVQLEPSYLINRIFTAVDALYLFLITSFSTVVKAIFILIFGLGIVLTISKSLVWFMLVLIPLNLLGFRYINKSLHTRMEAMQKSSAVANKNLIVTLTNSEAVKAGMSDDVLEYLLQKEIGLKFDALAATNKFAQSTSSVIAFVNQSFQTFVYIWTSIQIANGELPIAHLVLLSIILPLFFASLSELSKVNIDMNALTIANQFIRSELDGNREHEGKQQLSSIDTITLEQPTFQRGEQTYGYSISETLSKNDIVYLSGKSGSGKSSLLKLLLKFYPGTGIEINGLPIAELQNSSLRNKIAYLSQDATILTTTIEKNITHGKSLSVEQKKRIEDSGILDPVLETKSWDTLLIENGNNLSGGERQRIAVARLFVSEAEVYLLDESTSSIDEESAKAIFETVLKLAENKILIFTSHDKRNQQYANKQITV